MKSVIIRLKPFEVRTLMSLAYNEFNRRSEEIQEGKVEKVLIPAQESLVTELKEIWLKLRNKI